jgi:hypothetical protein
MALRFRRADRIDQHSRASDPAALPADLAVCLESVSVILRSAGEHGPRAVVQIDSCGWIHGVDETRKQLLRRWPALNEAQLTRALRHIGARVRQAAAPAQVKRRSWVMDW